MASDSNRNPQGWDNYQYGQSHSETPHNVGSPSNTTGRLAVPQEHHGDGEQQQRSVFRRRSSMSIRHAGGLNSIDNFARSWTRAAGFVEITPRAPSFIYSSDGGDESEDEYLRTDERPLHRKSLLRQELEAQHAYDDQTLEDGDMDEEAPYEQASEEQHMKRKPSKQRDDSILDIEPQLSSPLAGSYGTSYGTIGSRLNDASMRHAGRLWREQQESGAQAPDKEREPLLVKRVELEDGKIVNVVVGQSTMPQTIFNSINVLVGVGMLSLPLGVKYSGWLIGMAFLGFATAVTGYTARVLAKCLDVDGTLITFADLAYISFGQRARIVTSILFTLELLAACVALIVLFADSLDALIPGVGLTEWKILCGFILTPLSMVPLRVLSFTSVLGIVCCFSIVAIIFVDGLIKPNAPGSLRDPMPTYWFPEHWTTLPLSFGLLMSPWGGHSVFPNIYRDMRHPKKYVKSLKVTYVSTYLLDLSMAVAGYLMFGDGVRNEITANVIMNKGYPKVLSVCVVVFIAIIPLTKIPLNARPIISTVEILSGLDPRAISDTQALVGMSGFTRGILKFVIRVSVTITFVIISIIFPSFERIMALLGSTLCFTICVVLPLCFYLKIFGNDIPLKERILDWVLILGCSALAAVGTVWAFLPKATIRAT